MKSEYSIQKIHEAKVAEIHGEKRLKVRFIITKDLHSPLLKRKAAVRRMYEAGIGNRLLRLLNTL